VSALHSFLDELFIEQYTAQERDAPEMLGSDHPHDAGPETWVRVKV
jgi:hypothetical protein